MGSCSSFGKSLIPIFFLLIALGLTIKSNHVCNYVKINAMLLEKEMQLFTRGIWIGEPNPANLINVTDLTFRPTCNMYPSDMHFDPYWQSARVFSLLSDLFAILTLVLFMVLSWCTGKSGRKKLPWIAIACFVCSAFQGLTLLLLNSDACPNYRDVDMGAFQLTIPYRCKLDLGSLLTIGALPVWWMAGWVVMMCLPVEEEDDEYGLIAPMEGEYA